MLTETAPAPVVASMLPRSFRVLEVRPETADTSTLLLAPLHGPPLTFAAGQFTMIGCRGRREVPISISGDPSDPAVLQQTVRAVGEASTALVRSRAGDVVYVRGPYGRGWEVTDGRGGDVLIVAGGIGLAPVRPALLEVLGDRESYRRVLLVYGGRGPEHLLYREELEQWRGRFDLEVAVTVDAAPPSWRGNVGLVSAVLPVDLDGARTHAILCGPEIMMRLTSDLLVRRGIPASQVRISMERNMQCGIGVCGHCMLRELFVCVDGPVFDYPQVASLMTVRGL